MVFFIGLPDAYLFFGVKRWVFFFVFFLVSPLAPLQDDESKRHVAKIAGRASTLTHVQMHPTWDVDIYVKHNVIYNVYRICTYMYIYIDIQIYVFLCFLFLLK